MVSSTIIDLHTNIQEKKKSRFFQVGPSPARSLVQEKFLFEAQPSKDDSATQPSISCPSMRIDGANEAVKSLEKFDQTWKKCKNGFLATPMSLY